MGEFGRGEGKKRSVYGDTYDARFWQRDAAETRRRDACATLKRAIVFIAMYGPHFPYLERRVTARGLQAGSRGHGRPDALTPRFVAFNRSVKYPG